MRDAGVSNPGRTRIILAPLSLLWPLLVAVAAQEPHDVPTFASRVDLVTVDAIVQDAKGRPVRGLTAPDFTLLEDGKPQTIASFEAIDLGEITTAAGARASVGPVATNVQRERAGASSYVLLVDDMSLAPSRQVVVRAALGRFLDTSLRAGDELIFATTSGDAWWSARMPEGRDDLRALAERVRGRSLQDTGKDAVSEWEAFRIVHFEGRGEGGISTDPTGVPAPQVGSPSPTVAGASLADRVVERYYQRRVCDPDLIPAPGPPQPVTPRSVCRSMVQARAQEVDRRRVSRTRDALTAIDRAVFALTAFRGRKALLLFTEGFLNDTDVTAVQEVSGRCREANLVLYTLDVRGLMTGQPGAEALSAPSSGDVGAMQVEETDLVAAGSVGLAEDTGGFAVRDTNDLAAGAARVADESRVYYLLGYSPPAGKGPRDWRKLKVEVKRPELKVRARKGYTLRTLAEIAVAAEAKPVAKTDRSRKGENATGVAPLARVPADVARALASAHDTDAIPLRAMAYSFDGRPSGTVRTVLAVEADTQSLANLGGEERPRVVLSLSISATHRDSGKTQHVDQRVVVDAGFRKAIEGWLAVSREFDLPSGVAQARIVVRDEFLGRVGALTLRFVVPEAAGLRISTPILTDRLMPVGTATAALPVLLARREFPSSANLYCQFQVFGAGASSAPDQGVEGSYLLRRTDGAVVRQGVQSPITRSADGRLVRLLAFTLDGMAGGDYELVLRVLDKSTGQTQERIEPLRITAHAG